MYVLRGAVYVRGGNRSTLQGCGPDKGLVQHLRCVSPFSLCSTLIPLLFCIVRVDEYMCLAPRAQPMRLCDKRREEMRRIFGEVNTCTL